MTPPPTPTEDPCMSLDSPGMWFDQEEFRMEIRNYNPFPVKILRIYLDWPDPNGKLEKIKLEPDTIWDEGYGPPSEPSDIGIPDTSPFKPGSNRSIPPFGGSKDLVFFFGNDIQPFGYFLEMEFDNGCSIPPFSF